MAGEDQAERDAVVHLDTGALVVIAGPGSGKTRLLVDRLVWLLDERDIPPRDVLTLVFNRAAAGELRHRLAQRMPDRGFVELRIATFHSFALSVVDRYWGRLGLADRPILLDDGGRRTLVGELLADAAGITTDTWPYDADIVAKAAFADVVTDELAQIGELTPPDLALGRFQGRYEAALRERGLVDFSALIRFAAELLDDPTVREQVGARHLLVDEFQDTSESQLRIVEHLAGDATSLVAVGDPLQSIYAFRGASPASITTAADRLGAEVVSLSVSHRCPQPVLDAAEALVRRDAASDAGHGTLVGHQEGGGVAAVAFADLASETNWIADQLQSHHVEGVPWEHLAVLIRSTPHVLAAVTAALSRARIPFVAPAVAGPDEHPWVQRLESLLGYVVGRSELDDPALVIEASAGSPLVGGDPLFLREPSRRARRSDNPERVYQGWARDDANAGDTADHLVTLLTSIGSARKAHQKGLDVAEVAWALWVSLPLARELDATVGQPDALGAPIDLDPVTRSGVAAVSDWYGRVTAAVEETPGLTVEGWLDLDRNVRGAETWLADRRATDPGVRVLTIHQAKGLQFRHVYVPALVEGSFPVPERSSPLAGERPADHLAEERRLLYVALTRTERTVTLTCTVGPEGREEAAPSRFFADLGEHLHDPADLGSGSTADDPFTPIATRRGAEVAWSRLVRDPGTELADRVAGAHGLARLGAGTPWIEPEPIGPDVPFHDGQWWLSATTLDSYDECSLRFLYDKVLGLNPFEATDATLFGGIVHTALENWVNAGDLDDRDALAVELHRLFDLDMLGLGAAEGRANGETKLRAGCQEGPYRHRLDAIARQVVEELLPDAGPPAGTELKVRIEHPTGHMISGRIDLLCSLEPDGLEVIDWKTGRDGKRNDPDNRQLQVYYWLLRRTHPDLEVRRLRLARVEHGTWTHQKVNDDHDEVADTFISEVIGGLTAERYEATPGPPCRYCRFRTLCPAHDRGQEAPW